MPIAILVGILQNHHHNRYVMEIKLQFPVLPFYIQWNFEKRFEEDDEVQRWRDEIGETCIWYIASKLDS